MLPFTESRQSVIFLEGFTDLQNKNLNCKMWKKLPYGPVGAYCDVLALTDITLWMNVVTHAQPRLWDPFGTQPVKFKMLQLLFA